MPDDDFHATYRWVARLPWIVSIGALAVFGTLCLGLLDESNGGKPSPGIPVITNATATDAVAIRSAVVAWRGSCFGLIACSIAYLVVTLDGVRRFSRPDEHDQHNYVKTFGVCFISFVFGLMAFAAAYCLASDLRTTVIGAASTAGLPFAPSNAMLVVAILWGLAIWMAVAAVWASWIVVESTPIPISVHDAKQRAHQIAQQILDRVRWSRRLLLIGCVGPAAGVIEIIALSVVAARCAAATAPNGPNVSEQIILYGRASALETGFLFTLIQIAVYVPVALATYQVAEFVATANREGPVGRDGFDAWMKQCGLKDGSSFEPLARLLAVLSPIVAALIANVVAVPVG